ncbi:MAG TPA: formylglycine-generating enzyme family protein [Gaiellaceae bacterium]|nr:formylglycine-generating enzyme family protein [Gaiellaceae bacterium]
MRGCCSPSRGGAGQAAPPVATGDVSGTDGMVMISAGSFWMGSEDAFGYPEDGEGPLREVELGSYSIDACAVTNLEFGRSVEDTNYVTEAERFGWSFVFAGLLPDDFLPTQAVARAPWWRKVEGSNWPNPEGPSSTVVGREEHPVVHVSWNDAGAYASWAGKRLPREAEWERAARGGLESNVYPWGNELEPGGVHRMNVWQGSFPDSNSRADGYVGTAPVRSFPPNGLGLYETTGNVWEWTADPFDGAGVSRVQKGGSYLCHHSYCRRYRVAARQSSTPDSSTGNVGFRCARDA